jgi:glyoxylase-like metal-dependent hydrolase (beta-lactamase superfamily II)
LPSSPVVIAHRHSIEPLTHTEPLDRNLVDYTVDDGDTVEIGDLALRVHHLPGHTHDSVVYQLAQDLFVGDITFEWGGIGWMDVHWGSCVAQYKASLNRLLSLRPATLYPGHGGPCSLSEYSINRAVTSLDILEKIDGSPIMMGQPAPTRDPKEARETLRIPLRP